MESPRRFRADSPGWLEVWSIARYDLQLSEAEFWDMSVDEFDALLKRHNLRLEREDARAALICSVMANIFRGKGKPYRVKDFMPGKAKRKQTPAEMVEILKGFTAIRGKDSERVSPNR
ncbi:MAG: hypothetical protein PHQ43_13065 [Dehalococcoidales bacterium]|nr:hypothetical protein [Dehalococcoidales bacterium]